jgi:hypothetical protein
MFMVSVSTTDMSICERFIPKDSADLAAWAQAVGTVAAIAAAMWVSFRENWQRKRDAHTFARVTAVGMAMKLADAQDRVMALLVVFEKALILNKFEGVFSKYINDVQRIDFGGKECWLALIPLPNGCAFKLAEAHGILQGTTFIVTNLMVDYRTQFNDQSIDRDEGLDEFRSDRARHVSNRLAAVRILLNSALKECNEAAGFEQREVDGSDHAAVGSA